MRKAFIRTAIDLALAENGYPISYYGWVRPGWLEVWDGNTGSKPVRIRIPAIHSFKGSDLIDALRVLKAIGPPLPAPARFKPVPEPEQIELEAFLVSLADKRRIDAAHDAAPTPIAQWEETGAAA